MGFNDKMTDLADVIREKSGFEGKLSIEAMKEQINKFVSVDNPQLCTYKCYEVNEESKEWTGLKCDFSIIEGEVYKRVSFSTVKETLSFDLVPPKIGFFYNYDATLEAKYINVNAKYNDNYVFRTFEYGVEDSKCGGEGSVFFGKSADSLYLDEENESENSKTSSNELPCLNSQEGSILYRIGQDFDSDSFTVMFWAKVFEQGNDNSLTGVAFGKDGEKAIVVQVRNSGASGFTVLETFSSDQLLELDFDDPFSVSAPYFNPDETQVTSIDPRYWNHYAFVYDNRTKKCNTYINGIQGEEFTNNGKFNSIPPNVYYGVATTSRMAGLIVSKSALSKELIQWMALESPEEIENITRIYPQIILENEEVEYNEIVGQGNNFYIGEGGRCWWNLPYLGTINIKNVEHPDWIVYIPEWLEDSEGSGSFFSGTPTTAGEYEITGELIPDSYENYLIGTFCENYKVPSVPFTIKINVDDGLLYIKINSIAGGGYVRISGNKIIASGILGVDGGEESDDYAYAELTINGEETTIPLQNGENEITITIGELKDFEIISGDENLIVYDESSQQVSFKMGGDITEHHYIELKFKYRI